MKFKDKYPDMTPDDKRGDILLGDSSRPCIICGESTQYVEIYSEGHFCSEECVDALYEKVDAFYRKVGKYEI